MSGLNRAIRALEELERDSSLPIVPERMPGHQVGNGGKAYKSLTAAVKAAEGARDDARAGVRECGRLEERSGGHEAEARRCMEAARRLLVWCSGCAVVCAGVLVWVLTVGAGR